MTKLSAPSGVLQGTRRRYSTAILTRCKCEDWTTWTFKDYYRDARRAARAFLKLGRMASARFLCEQAAKHTQMSKAFPSICGTAGERSRMCKQLHHRETVVSMHHPPFNTVLTVIGVIIVAIRDISYHPLNSLTEARPPKSSPSPRPKSWSPS